MTREQAIQNAILQSERREDEDRPRWWIRLLWLLLVIAMLCLPLAVHGQTNAAAVSARVASGGMLAIYRGALRVWWGPCSVEGCNSELVTLQSSDDPLGLTATTTQGGGYISWTKAHGSANLLPSVSGSDVALKFTVTNSAAAPIRYLAFRFGSSIGTYTHHDAPLRPENWNWFQGMNDRWRAAWPSEWNPVRCKAWQSPTASFGLSAPGLGLTRVLLLNDHGNDPLAIVEANLQPGATRSFTFSLRVAAPGAPLCDVLGGYAEQWRAEWGAQRYQADPRPVAQFVRYHYHHGNEPPAGNPNGFHPDWRPDQAEDNATAWTEAVAANALANGFQGVIAWGFARGNPAMESCPSYPADSTDLTPVQRGLYDRCYAAPFVAKGLKVGTLQRGAVHVVLRQDGAKFVPADGGAASLELMVDRLTKAGPLVYFDSTPFEGGLTAYAASPFDLWALFSRLRDRLGASPQWWLEGRCDLFWRDAGCYVDKRDGWPLTADVFRLVYPQGGVLCNDSTAEPAAHRQWCDQRGYAALIADWRTGGAIPPPMQQAMPKPLQLKASR